MWKENSIISGSTIRQLVYVAGVDLVKYAAMFRVSGAHGHAAGNLFR
jgi:hypothetical protein